VILLVCCIFLCDQWLFNSLSILMAFGRTDFGLIFLSSLLIFFQVFAELFGSLNEAVWGKSCYLDKMLFSKKSHFCEFFIKRLLKISIFDLFQKFFYILLLWGCPHLVPKNQNDTATDIWDISKNRLQITTFASHALKADWICK